MFVPFSDRTSIIQTTLDCCTRPGGNYRGRLSVLRERGRENKSLGVFVQHEREHEDPPRVIRYYRLLAKAREEAVKAYNSGEPKDFCPYRKGSIFRREWLKAWAKCAKEDGRKSDV